MEFKDRLKEKRSAAGLSQSQLAKTAGVTTRTIQNYELGQRRPSNMQIVQKMADALETTTEYLLSSTKAYMVDSYEKGNAKEATRDIDELVYQVTGMFTEGYLNDETLDRAMKELNNAYWVAKEKNKKFIRKDYLKEQKNK